MNLVAQLTPANVNPNNAPGHTLAKWELIFALWLLIFDLSGMEFVLRNIAPVIPPNQARSLIVILDSMSVLGALFSREVDLWSLISDSVTRAKTRWLLNWPTPSNTSTTSSYPLYRLALLTQLRRDYNWYVKFHKVWWERTILKFEHITWKLAKQFNRISHNCRGDEGSNDQKLT